MKRLFSVVYVVAALLSMTSCNRDDIRSFKTTGEPSEISLQTQDYSRVETHDYFDITLLPDSSNYIKISGGKNLISFIECCISDGVLKIYDNNGCRWLRKYQPVQLQIGVKNIDKITLYESATLNCADTLHFNWFAFENHCVYCNISLLIDCYRLEFWSHASTGDYHMSGTCHEAYLYNRGTGYLYADSLIAKRATITHMSTGNSYIHVLDSLEVSEISRGNVYLNGCPRVHTTESSYLEQLIKNCP